MKAFGLSRPALGAILVLAVLATLLIAGRSAEFAALEPRQDHAWFTQWVRALLEAERFLPRQEAGESWRAALEADDRSALHVLLRQLYAVPFALLQLGALAWYAVFGLVMGVSMPAQVAISVVASTLGMVALALFAWWVGARDGARLEAALFAAATFGFVAGSSFLRVFSALGAHNVAILVLTLMVAASERWLYLLRRGEEAAARRAGCATLLLYSVCLFTYHGGTLLAPPILALTLLAEGHLPLATRLRWVAGLVLWTCVLMLPLAAAAWLGQQESFIGSREQGIVAYIGLVLSEGESSLAVSTFLQRARLWYGAQGEVFSEAGLLLGLAGLAGLALRRGVRAPLIVAVVHFACGAVVASFTQYNRTSAYLVPFLALGAAWMIAAPAAALLARRRLVAAPVVAGALLLGGLHAATELPRLRDPLRVASWEPYLRQQGDWLPAQLAIEALLPADAVLIPWDYQVSHLYNCFRTPDGPRPYVPLSTLSGRAADGSLAGYLARRRLVLPRDRALFLLAPADVPEERLVMPGWETMPPRVVARWDRKAWPLLYPSLVLYELRAPP